MTPEALARLVMLGGVLLVPLPVMAQGQPPAPAQEQAARAGGERSDDRQGEATAQTKAEEDQQSDVSPDALRAPLLGRLLRRRILIDRPGFSVETQGKLQVQLLDSDSDDATTEDDVFIRRFRPSLIGRIGSHWKWKFEVELSTEIEEGAIDLDRLDLRDVYVRYDGFAVPGRRLTLGNQKPPFSRDLMTSSRELLLIERSVAGNRRAGVPDRTVGVHFRDEAREGKVSYWASVGVVAHDPDVDRMEFETIIGGSGDLNTGLLYVGRLDFHPLGAMTYGDGDRHTPELKTTWSAAGYHWENDGDNNLRSEGGLSLDPQKADLDSATGLELSGGLRGRGVTLDWQHNRIEGETVVPDFTGGIYAQGETRLDVSTLEGGYRFRDPKVEVGGGLSRVRGDTLVDDWDQARLAVNVYAGRKGLFKVQIAHTWDWSRRGEPGNDLQETRIQLQYVW